MLAGLKKKLAEISKLSPYRKLSKWIRSITNHLYWTVSTSNPSTVERKERWCSLQNHLQNIHSHPENKTFKECAHEPLPREFMVDGTVHIRDFFTKGNMNDSFHSLNQYCYL